MNTSSNQNLNSSSNMTAWGIGPRMALLTTPFIVIFLTIHIAFYPIFLLPIDYIFILIIGCALIFIGLLLLLKSRKLINEAFDASELVTESIYGYIRHPVYAAFILFICPGITCLFNSWICFFIPLILYMIFRFLIIREENYCLEKFGERYEHYKNNVNRILPRFRKYKPI